MTTQLTKTYPSGRVKIRITGLSSARANTLRRSILDDTPAMAIETVEFSKNGSVLYDEMLAHRLGLVVLRTDLDSYNVPAKCTCEGAGCSKCTLLLTLSAKGPCTVYADEIVSKDPKVKPVHGKTPIVKLLKGQELEFQATAVLGHGRTHAKFAPGLPWFNHIPKITVNNDHLQFHDYTEKFPPQIYNNGTIDKNLIESLDLVDACDGIHSEIVNIEYDTTGVDFHFEPWGSLTPKETMHAAIQSIRTLLKQFTDAFEQKNAGVAEPGQMR